MLLATHDKQVPQKYKHEINSAEALTVQEHNIINEQTLENNETSKGISYPEGKSQYVLLKCEEGENLQLFEHPVYDQVTSLERPGDQIIDRVENITVQEDTLGVKMSLETGSAPLDEEKV